MKPLEFLKDKIKPGMMLPELVDIFEEMCRIPIQDDVQIFLETGAFDFTGETKFYFSLTRQYPNGEDEYFQLQMDVLFPLTDKNKHLNDTTWDSDVEGDFFRCVRSSRAYLTMKDTVPVDVQVFLDET